MHFSIPDTVELKENNGSTYTAFNIHMNGVFHCSVRYKQLNNLHEQLKKQFVTLPVSFPPKKFLPLTKSQLDERRLLLEKYVQQVSQDSRVCSDGLLSNFLLSAQRETQLQQSDAKGTDDTVILDVYLMNGQRVPITIPSSLHTDHVLEVVANTINLPAEYVYYFCLYLLKKDNNNTISLSRRLVECESPYFSLRAAQSKLIGPDGSSVIRIVLRKAYWDPLYDDELLTDSVALNLLYIQTIGDVERGWVQASKEVQLQLASLQAKGSKRDYVSLARTLPLYGCVQFIPCVCDYPTPDTPVVVSATHKDLHFRFRLPDNEVKEGFFKVTRMKCWRITTSFNDSSSTPDSSSSGSGGTECNSSNESISPNSLNGSSTCGGSNSSIANQGDQPKLDISFEYLIARDKLQWITVTGEQAILMSVCLQSIVDELLIKKNGNKYKRKPPEMGQQWNYMRRDGSSQEMNKSATTDCINRECGPCPKRNNQPSPLPRQMSMRVLSEKLSKGSPSNKRNSAEPTTGKPAVQNDAFDGIGDDDL